MSMSMSKDTNMAECISDLSERLDRINDLKLEYAAALETVARDLEISSQVIAKVVNANSRNKRSKLLAEAEQMLGLLTAILDGSQ